MSATQKALKELAVRVNEAAPVVEKASTVETAAPVGKEQYQWFTHTGKEITAMNDKGRTMHLQTGDIYGVRKSTSGKYLRLVTANQGVSKVFTLDAEVAALIAKTAKVAKVPANVK